MNRKFLVQWIKKRGKWPKDQQAQGPFVSFDAAMHFAQTSGECRNARSVVILRESDGVNAGKFFLDFIVK